VAADDSAPEDSRLDLSAPLDDSHLAAPDFNNTISSTNSASQPVDKSLNTSQKSVKTILKKPAILKPCIPRGGRESVSSQGSESFQISSIDRKRALNKSLWTKEERSSFRSSALPTIADRSSKWEDTDDDDGFAQFSRGGSIPLPDGSGSCVINNSRSSTRSRRSLRSVSGVSNSPPQDSDPNRVFNGSLLDSSHHLNASNCSRKPPPKPSRTPKLRNQSEDTIPKQLVNSERPVPGPQTRRYTRQDVSRTSIASGDNNSFNTSSHSRNGSILKSADSSSNNRESFRVRFHRSASSDRPRVRRERDDASRRRSRSADDYILNGTPLANQLQRRDSKVRVLDLSNPEIVTYEMDESDFVAEFKQDFIDSATSRAAAAARLKPLPPLRQTSRYSDDSVDLDMTVRDFLMQSAGNDEGDRKLLDGFFSYTMTHESTTEDDDNSISEDSLEVPKSPLDKVKSMTVDEISLTSPQRDFALKLPTYGHNLYLEGQSVKENHDPSPMNELKVFDDSGKLGKVSKNSDTTSDYSQDSSEVDSNYNRQIRDLQARIKQTTLGRTQAEDGSFDSAFDSLERPTRVVASSQSAQQRRRIPSPSGFDASFVPQDLNGNLSTVEEISRASSDISRLDYTPRHPDRNVYSATSADSHYEFDEVFSRSDARDRTASKSFDDFARTFRSPHSTSPDDGFGTSPVEELPVKLPPKKHLMDFRRDSFGNITPGRVANLRAGFEFK